MGRTPSSRTSDAGRARLVVLNNTFSPVAVEGLAREVIQHLSARSGQALSGSRAEILTLCRALTAPHPYSARVQIDTLVDAGVPIPSIYAEYLAAAAVELGRQSEVDDLSFVQVAVGLARIHAILDDLRQRNPAPPVDRPRRVAFAAVPGEQHLLGVAMATDLFRRAGWDVDHLIEDDHTTLPTRLDDTDFVLLGLSATTRSGMAALVRLILALRARRPDLRILVSGRVVVDRRRDLEVLGVDAIVTDVNDVLKAAADLIGPPSGRDATC